MAKSQVLEVELSEEIVAVLGQMAVRSGSLSITEELKRSIELRKFFSDRTESGESIFLFNREKETMTPVIYS